MIDMLRRNRPVFCGPCTAMDEIERRVKRVVSAVHPGSGWDVFCDVYETADAYIIEADVPGLEREDIQITAHDDLLTLKGERRNDVCGSDKARYEQRERGTGAFERTFRFPGRFDAEKVTAQYRNGVLRVILPRRPEDRTHTVEVAFE